MPVGSHRSRATCAAAAASLLASGCAFSNIDLVQDHRLSMSAPGDYSTIHLPVTLSWTTKNLAAGDTFAVFLDRAVVKPDQTLAAVAAGDMSCKTPASCITPDYLRLRGVYATSDDSLTLTMLPDLRNSGTGKPRDTHVATVIILHNGRRDGEGAFTRTFTIERGANQ